MTEEHFLTVKVLKEILEEENVPDNAKVYYARIEDIYFKERGWKTIGIPWPCRPEYNQPSIRAFTGWYNEKLNAFLINAHF